MKRQVAPKQTHHHPKKKTRRTKKKPFPILSLPLDCLTKVFEEIVFSTPVLKIIDLALVCKKFHLAVQHRNVQHFLFGQLFSSSFGKVPQIKDNPNKYSVRYFLKKISYLWKLQRRQLEIGCGHDTKSPLSFKGSVKEFMYNDDCVQLVSTKSNMGNVWELQDILGLPVDLFTDESFWSLQTAFSLKDVGAFTLPDSISVCSKLEGLDCERTLIHALPDAIGSLTSLIDLEITLSFLKTIPPSMSNLKNLETINFDSNKIKSFPKDMQFPNLRVFCARNNRIKVFPEFLVQCPKLRIIELDHNRIPEIPASIIQLQVIYRLDLESNQITEIPDLPPSIHHLGISENPITTIGSLPKELTQWEVSKTNLKRFPTDIELPKLAKIDARSNNIEVFPEFLLRCPKLTVVNMPLNAFREIPSSISNLNGLLELSLECNQIIEIPEGLEESPIKSLTLFLNPITTVRSLPRGICQLDLSEARIKTFPNHFELPHLRFFIADLNMIETFPEFLFQCPNLEKIFMNDNSIREIPSSIGKLKKLTILSLTSNQITEIPEGLTHSPISSLFVDWNPLKTIRSLPGHLLELKIKGTHITEIPDIIGDCKYLSSIRASDCEDLVKISDRIGSCVELRILKISGSQITELPASIVSCPLYMLHVQSCPLKEDGIPAGLSGCMIFRDSQQT